MITFALDLKLYNSKTLPLTTLNIPWGLSMIFQDWEYMTIFITKNMFVEWKRRKERTSNMWMPWTSLSFKMINITDYDLRWPMGSVHFSKHLLMYHSRSKCNKSLSYSWQCSFLWDFWLWGKTYKLICSYSTYD